MFGSEGVGHHAYIGYPRNRIFVAVQGGTAHRLAAVSESERSQLGREFVLSVIIGIGLGLGIERSVLHRGVAARELRGNVVHHAFRLRIILIGRHHVEHHILYIARSTLFESLLVVVIILFDIGLGNVHQRIGYGIVILADDVGRIGMVGNPHSVSHLQRVGIETALDQSKVLAHYPFLLHLIAQKSPDGIRTIASGHAAHEGFHELRVEQPRRRIDEGRGYDRRQINTVEHVQLFRLRNRHPHPVESGFERIIHDKLLPCEVIDHLLLLSGESVAAPHHLVYGTHVIGLVQEIDITDVLAVDFAHTHLAGIHQAAAGGEYVADKECEKRHENHDGHYHASFGS